MAALFLSREPTLEEYWRAIVLFGRNVASYKFALAKSLLEIRPAAGQLLKLEDLAPTYSTHLSHDSPGSYIVGGCFSRRRRREKKIAGRGLPSGLCHIGKGSYWQLAG